MLKNWFLLASVSCGVGFGSTFVISRNLQQSTLAGLVTVPAVATSLTLLSHQRKREIERQVAKSQSSLNHVRQQEQVVQDNYQKVSTQGQKLQTEIAQLRLNVDQYREKRAKLEQEINSLVLHKQAQESSLAQLETQITNKQNNLEKINVELAQSKSKRKLEIDAEIRQNSIFKKQLEFEIAYLQDQERSLHARIALHEVDLKDDVNPQIGIKEWGESLIFKDNPHLKILEHIDRHNVINESEVNFKLGNSRKGREFANKFRDYLPYLPFSIEVEPSSSGNRYIKAIVTIAKSQNFSAVLPPDVVTTEFPLLETDRSNSALEEQAIQDSAFDIESQSNDDLIEYNNMYYNCRSCGSAPVRGHDYCYKCN